MEISCKYGKYSYAIILLRLLCCYFCHIVNLLKGKNQFAFFHPYSISVVPSAYVTYSISWLSLLPKQTKRMPKKISKDFVTWPILILWVPRMKILKKLDLKIQTDSISILVLDPNLEYPKDPWIVPYGIVYWISYHDIKTQVILCHMALFKWIFLSTGDSLLMPYGTN